MIETWEKVIDLNYINSDLLGDIGAERVVTIKDIDYGEVSDQNGKKTTKRAIYFEECLPMVLNNTNAKNLRRIFKNDEPKDLVGRKITIYVAKVKAFGKETTGIRIKEAPGVKCESCGTYIEPTSTMTVSQLVKYSKKHCNKKTLCIECMKKYKEQLEENK